MVIKLAHVPRLAMIKHTREWIDLHSIATLRVYVSSFLLTQWQYHRYPKPILAIIMMVVPICHVWCLAIISINSLLLPRTILNFCFVWTVTGIKTASIHLHWVSRYLCKMIPYVWLYFSALTIFVFCRRLEPVQQGPTKTNTKGVTHTHLLHVHGLWSLENV